ncbi:MAG: [FeFe] hydrogenase H-cluster maturation GTPase HydF [Victivallaceae bacterium]|nr:[FeFe] hydrogenase H-cluster maturation GTPase HydF [Victivallaceae bacterium]
MEDTPRSLRLQIAVAGRTNSGKSSFMNLITGQDVAITSPIPGTTTDVVEKAMELRPLGPVLFLDTAGIDDETELGGRRVERSRRALDRADVILLVTTPGVWAAPEEKVLAAARERKTGLIAVVNKCDQTSPAPEFLAMLKEKTSFAPIVTSSVGGNPEREKALPQLKDALLAACPDDFVQPPPLIGDLTTSGDVIIMIVPVDKQAPKGRIIMPQMQVLRDALDHGVQTLTVRESEYKAALNALKAPPALVICDSQVVDLMVRETPQAVPCTTFSILFARLKGDMNLLAAGTAALAKLSPGDPVMVAEACTHHASEDDIGRVKIPRWLAQKTGGELKVKVASGRDFPDDLGDQKMIIHCGSCMLNRRETLRRMTLAHNAGVPITNYGMAISYSKGVLERVLSPFPEALETYKKALK